MIEFQGPGILLDIEGTTSSVTFVYDVMFPYVREHLSDYLASRWHEPRLVEICQQLAADAPQATAGQLTDISLADTDRQALVHHEVMRQMDADMKVTGLKALQGDIWKAGFESGALVSHVYPDVLPQLESWKAAGMSLRIYSSGSIAAQKLFFGHTESGDLLHLFDGHYDTTIGGKKSSDSYEAIAADWQLPPTDVLFVSDVEAELDAARAAGMKTALCCRNEVLTSTHDLCTTFVEISAIPARSASE